MFSLELQIPSEALSELRGSFIALFQATSETVSVACALVPIVDALPIRVTIGESLFFADPMEPPFSSCRRLTPALFSAPLEPRRKLAFDGAEFVDVGSVSSDFKFGLRNDRPLPLTCGSGWVVGINGVEGNAPATLRRLSPGATAFFGLEDSFLLGVAGLPGIPPGPGLLMATSILSTPDSFMTPPCAPTLGRFVELRFDRSDRLTATYDPSRGRFDVRST